MRDQAEVCAERLRELASDARYASRSDDLMSLADAVEDDDNDEGWGGVDLLTAFPSTSSVTTYRRLRLERSLGALAAVSVFLPVAWTWWSFHSATAAYARLIAEDAEKGRTFLALWTVGFDGELTGLHGLHRLIPMALVSVILIVVAVTLIVAHRWAAQRNADREEVESAAAQSELTSAITTAQRMLNLRRVDDPSRMEAMVKRSVRRLLQAHEDTRAGALELKEATQELRDTLTPVIAGATAAGTEAAHAAQAAQSSTDSLVRAVESSQDAARQSAAVSQKAAQDAGVAFSQALDATLDTFSKRVTAQVADLKNATTTAISGAATQAQVASDSLTREASAIQASHSALSAELSKLSAANSAVSHDVASVSSDLRGVLTGLEAALARHDSALQGQVSELTAARDAAERMLESLERLGDDVRSRVPAS